ncbi:MAG: IS1595 family transposase [Vulcanimicrobiaceae bacterium]
MEKQSVPETMLEAVRQFADPQVAHDFFVQIRFPNGVACPRMGCGSARVAYMANVCRWYCNECKKQFSAKVGTIFEDSPIGLDKWLPAIWLIASNRNGISSYEIARALSVTQKTAWFMLHRIREAMRNESYEKIAGPVEVDETFVGGKVKAPRNAAGRAVRRGPNYGKTTVMGMVERKGNVRAFVVPSNRRYTLADKIREHIERGATVYTDGLASYARLNEEYTHHVIDHAVEYVRGHVHTNNIEGFWSVFKRTIRGTYIAPRPQHLQRYVEEQVFRFNARHDGDGPRFADACKGADGKRLTYKALVAKP